MGQGRCLQGTMVRAAAVAGALLVLGMAAHAATINVPADQPTIQAAIDAATAGDTINVAAGTYRENVLWDNKDLTIVGAGMGVTVLSGDTDNDGTPDGRCMTMTTLTSASSLNGFTLADGHASATSPVTANVGGGLYMNLADVYIANCEVRDCTSVGPGGGIYLYNSSDSVFDGLSVHDCSAGNWGGGIYNVLGPALIDVCEINANTASYGGGIYMAGVATATTVQDSYIHDNEASTDGGGVMLNESYATFQRNEITLNLADRGGAIYMYGSSATIRGNLIHHNMCNNFPAGISALNCAATIEGNTITDNDDGGVSNGTTITTTPLVLTNNIIYGNISIDVAGTNYNSSYNCIGSGITAGTGNITSDPLFFAPDPTFSDPLNADYHLKSQGGRWNGATFVYDAVNSPAIDAGDPTSAFSNELAPNGGRRNLGVYGNTAEASKTGDGQTPVVDGVTITPDPATSSDTLTAVPGTWYDPNGDPPGYDYQWALWDGSAWQDLIGETSSTLDPSNFARGDIVQVTIWPNDGTNQGTPVTDDITISNGVPSVAAVLITPDPATTADDLVAVTGVWDDPDGDPEGYDWQWEVDTGGGYAVVPGATTDTLASTHFQRGDAVRVTVTPNDGTDTGTPVIDTITISNGIPSVAAVLITPDPATTADDLTAVTGVWDDPDGDPEGYDWQWEVDSGSGFAIVGGATTDTLASANFSRGDVVRVTATPDDGLDTGTPVTDTITISNGIPSVAAVLISPDPATTTDDLTAVTGVWNDPEGDPEGYDWQWEVDTGSGFTVVPGATTDTLASTNFAKGDTVRVTATPNDGIDTGTPVTDTVTISNSPPSLASVTIAPDPAYTNTDLTATPAGWNDADGDPEGYDWQWEVDTGSGFSIIAGATTDTLANANFARGDVVRVTATPDDGADTGTPVIDTVTISNVAPSVGSVAISPDPAYTNTDLAATPSGWSDPDGDAEGYDWQWEVDSGSGFAIVGGATTDTLASANFSRGDVVRVTATPNDGIDTGSAVMDTITISDAPPTAPTVDVTPNSPTISDDLNVAASGSTDPDGDAVTYSYSWDKDGVPQPALDDQVTVPAAQTLTGEVWTCTVTPVANGLDGTTADDSVTIGNTPPTAPTTCTIAPAGPTVNEDLTASASGASDVDPGDTISYEYHWRNSTDGGTTWSAWRITGAVLPSGETVLGEMWQARARASDGSDVGPWKTSSPVTIMNTVPTAPTMCSISPTNPEDGDDLTASASGSTDPDPRDSISYEYHWRNSTDGGATWSAWRITGAVLSSAETVVGELWQARARATDGIESSSWTTSTAVRVGNVAPTAPTTCSIAPADPNVDEDLTASAAGSTDPDIGDSVSYEYHWRNSTDGGATWSAWRITGATLPSAETADGEMWQARARATDGVESSAWTASAPVTVQNTAPTAPTTCAIAPTNPDVGDDLTASASGSTDPDPRDSISYEYHWRNSTDGGATWSAWRITGATLPGAETALGEWWQARARATDGVESGPWTTSAPVKIGNTPPTMPTTCSITPASPTVSEDLTASASGSTDPDPGDTVSYEYQWRSSTDGGATWSAWRITGATLPGAETTLGETWQARARATDGTDVSAWRVCSAVTIHGITITAGPTASPSPAAAGGQVQCSVTAEDSAGHGLSYRWTTTGSAGSFDDPTSANPIWTAPTGACDAGGDYTLTVTITCTVDPDVSVSADVAVTVLPTLNLTMTAGWNMGTIGHAADLNAMFGDIVGPSVLSAFTWNASQFRYEPVDLQGTPGASIVPYGTWMLSSENGSVQIPLAPSEQHVVNVGQGWNLLANPYGCPLDLTAGLASSADGQIILPAYIWDAQSFSYAQTTVIPPGASFWALSTYSGQATIDPAGITTARTATASSLADTPRAGSAEGIQLAVSAGGMTDDALWIGTSSEAGGMRTPKPPMMPNAVGAYLDVTDGMGYARSLVPQSAEQAWTLTVNSPADEEVSLRIVDTSALPGHMAVWLTDQATGRRVDLRHSPNYTFTARTGQRRFEIEIGERSEMLQVMGVSAQPTGTGAEISFTLSAAGTVTVDVINIAGRTVKRLVTNRESDAGVQSLSWNGVSDRGTRVPGGIYLVRVNAAAPTGEQCQGLTTMRVER